MADHDILGDAVERLEWDESRAERKGGRSVSRMAQLTRRTALTGGAAGLAAVLLEACGSSSPSTSKAASSSAAADIFGVDKSFHFTLVNHVMSNTFFAPTQNGASDACTLLGAKYTWTGSQTSNVSQMVDSLNAAVTDKSDGIGVALIDPTAFNPAVASAVSAGIPVVSYNADEPNARLAYIGQDLYLAGQEMGKKIQSLLPGGGDIAVFIATPGTANLQPRINGIVDQLKGTNITVTQAASGAAETQELTLIKAFVSSHTDFKGFFAVDAGSTAAIVQAIQDGGLKGKFVSGGVDLTPVTETGLASGYIDFTVDQQPYLQGFLPILELYLHQVSNGLAGAADVDTGLRFLNSRTILPYSSTKSRFEGTGTSAGVQSA